MAQRLDESTRLTMKVRTGTSDAGTGIYANRSITNANPDLSDNDAYSVLTKFAALSKYEATKFTRYDDAVLGADD